MAVNNALSNQATDVDLAAYESLSALGWKRGDTLLYHHSYALTEDEQKDFPGSKSINPDFVLVDLQAMPLAVMENKLDDPQKALPKLRLKYTAGCCTRTSFTPAPPTARAGCESCSSTFTSGNWKSHKNKNIHAVVIDTLESNE